MKKNINEQDNHFRIAHKEAKIGVALVIINFLMWFGFAYGLGSGDPASYHFVFGMPAWFFYSCIFTFIVMVILVILCVKFLFKEVSFEEDEGRGDHT